MRQTTETLAKTIAKIVWDWCEVRQPSLDDLTTDVLALIFQVQMESMQPDADLVRWFGELEISDRASLICEVERISGGPADFILYYTDDEDEFLPIREWRDFSDEDRVVN